jgi:hypothetical protein
VRDRRQGTEKDCEHPQSLSSKRIASHPRDQAGSVRLGDILLGESVWA